MLMRQDLHLPDLYRPIHETNPNFLRVLAKSAETAVKHSRGSRPSMNRTWGTASRGSEDYGNSIHLLGSLETPLMQMQPQT